MTDRPKRALLATTHFEVVAGSELVLLEVAEHLIARGFACDLLACSLDPPMREMAAAAGCALHLDPAAIRPLTYDVVWIQTRMEALLDYAPHPEDRERTLFAFAHLDLGWSLTQPGVVLEELLADAVIVTGEEARAHFTAAGLPPALIRPFRNAAPARFHRPPGLPRPALRRLLIVSNHAPEEVLAAAALLRARGITVEHWGAGGDVQGRRLEPAALEDADAVLTIGKTVPYALAMRLPAYVYDHFGGPGWLTEVNFAAAAAANFSGRCCRRRLPPEALAEELLAGFAEAAALAAARPEAALDPFRLEPFPDSLIAATAAVPSLAERRAALERNATAWRREAHLARAANTYFTAWRYAHRLLHGA
ncbi:hypothetical protein JMJ55_11990 [Belnapia sp. T6]|uniref:Uncharacterized protein n=1 Tax=Belnapia mucosa TaxID=2804532 RepID=A0ABS1V2X6_9PROT|nr:hypothetical protein [Belnapia mucosa]MBL6456048.1 hypothetical protein [Belnapia mucosa]